MKIGRKMANAPPKPSEDAYRQVLGLLELGECSSNPDIRAAAIEIAKRTSTDQSDRSSRISPKTIMFAGTFVLILTLVACWYAQTHYAAPLANAITKVALVIAVLLIALYTLLSGHLSQDNFVNLCTAACGKVKGVFSQPHAGTVGEIKSEAGVEKTPTADDSPTIL